MKRISRELFSFCSITMASMQIIACGSSTNSVTSAGTTSDFNEVYQQMQEAAPSIDAPFAPSYLTHFSPSKLYEALSLWDNASTAFMGVSSTGTNPQGFVSGMMDSTQDQSILERAKMPFLIACCLDVLAQKTGSLFTTGTQTVTFTNAVVGVCGQASDFTGMIGNSLTMVVTNATDTTYYDQIVSMDRATNPMFNSQDQWMYMRNSSTELNFIHIEDNSGARDGSELSVNSISYNKSTQAGVFQYLTKGTNDRKIYRMVMDDASDDVRVMAFKYSTSGSNPEVTLNAASTFASQTHAALSMSWANQTAPYNTTMTNGNACILTSDASIVTDNTLTCAANSKTVLASSGVNSTTGAGLAVMNMDGNTVKTDANAGDLDNNLPTFTAGTILSAGLGL
jgi:hypothetical protein